MEPGSLVHEHAIDPLVARAALHKLKARFLEALTGTSAAALLGLMLLISGHGRLAFAPFAGAVAGLLLTAYAYSDRVALVQRLVRQRSAYEIAEVASAAEALVSQEARDNVARTLGRLILEAEGIEPQNPANALLHRRLIANRDDAVAIAFHLARPASTVHPTAMALLTRVLTQATLSPLYNERIPQQDLRVALRRVLAGIRG